MGNVYEGDKAAEGHLKSWAHCTLQWIHRFIFTIYQLGQTAFFHS